MGGGDRVQGRFCIIPCKPEYSPPIREKSLGENPWGKGTPGNPKLGGLESIEAMVTIDIEDGGSEGGLEEGETESDLSGVFDPGGEESLK